MPDDDDVMGLAALWVYWSALGIVCALTLRVVVAYLFA